MKKALLVLILIFLTSTCVFAVDYSKYSLSDINSIRKATEAYQLEFKDKKGTKEAQTEYLRFLEFYYRAVDRQSELITNFPFNALEGSYQKQAQKYSKKYASKGLFVQFDEGNFFIVQNFEYLYKNFAPYLTKDWQDLLEFETYFNKRIISDGRYVIPKSEFLGLLNFYKEFFKKYPKFTDRDSIKNIIELYQKHLKSYPNAYL